jgi:hypothetical protein
MAHPVGALVRKKSAVMRSLGLNLGNQSQVYKSRAKCQGQRIDRVCHGQKPCLSGLSLDESQSFDVSVKGPGRSDAKKMAVWQIVGAL